MFFASKVSLTKGKVGNIGLEKRLELIFLLGVSNQINRTKLFTEY